jgi:hypothetical protein
MAIGREQLVAQFDHGAVTEFEVEGLGVVRLRSPAFGVWYGIVQEQRAHEGSLLPDSVIARTVAACLVDDDNKPLVSDPEEVLRLPPATMMAIYNRCVEDVMQLRKSAVEDEAKK